MPLRIVVLTKPVPDPAAAAEKLGPDGRLDRAASPAVINGNDEYALEAALKLVDGARGRGDAAVDGAAERASRRCARASRWAPTEGVLVSDPALAGSDYTSTVAALVAALEGLEYDLVLAGFDTSDGVGGVVGAAIATKLKLPYLSSAAKIEPDPGAGRSACGGSARPASTCSRRRCPR